MIESEYVSVVIPAYNAAETLDETLQSVRTQTHIRLEIIVVDDGSTDETCAIAERHAAEDPRVQLLKQANAGVAAARNTGWQHARYDYIAFVDADDLWAPTKIEKQLHALINGGEKVGLAYCWFERIDGKSIVIGSGPRPLHEGDVLEQIAEGNFIGNGSAVLVRRQALIDVNGFEPGLRAAGAQGCEDLLFYCRVAEKYHYAVVPEALLGYRFLPNNMSSNRTKMLRSWMLVVDEMLTRHPNLTGQLHRGLSHYCLWLIYDALFHNPKQLPALMMLVLSTYPKMGLRLLLKDLPVAVLSKLRHLMKKVLRRPMSSSSSSAARKFTLGELD